MTALSPALGQSLSDHPLRTAFLKWQCRVRQIAMRDHEGRPDDGIMPEVTPAGHTAPMGHIITVLKQGAGAFHVAGIRTYGGQDQRPRPAPRSGDPVPFGHLLPEGGRVSRTS